MPGVFEVDYLIKDNDKWKSFPKPIPKYVAADTIVEAVKRAQDFEDDNLTLLKCDLVANGNVALPKKYKGVQPAADQKEGT
jgi:hypothetical protein